MSGPRAQPAESFGFERIIYEKRDWRATVTINRPEVLNSFDFQTLKEMERAFEDASWDDSVAVLVLTGAGERAFCTGADLREQEARMVPRPRDYWKWMGAFIDAHDRLRNIGKPTVARLNGMVVGGGNEFNIACDLAVAADDITIRQIGTARGSVPAGGATQWLPLIIGDRRAREMLWLSEPVTAQQALEWGLVNRVVPDDEVEIAATELAAALAKGPRSLGMIKRIAWAAADSSLETALVNERLGQRAACRTEDFIEGVTAFAGKRPPEFKGR